MTEKRVCSNCHWFETFPEDNEDCCFVTGRMETLTDRSYAEECPYYYILHSNMKLKHP